jgi:hypothetical protein
MQTFSVVYRLFFKLPKIGVKRGFSRNFLGIGVYRLIAPISISNLLTAGVNPCVNLTPISN